MTFQHWQLLNCIETTLNYIKHNNDDTIVSLYFIAEIKKKMLFIINMKTGNVKKMKVL